MFWGLACHGTGRVYLSTARSAQEFLSCPRVLVPSCLILDVSLPGLNGLDLQKRIASDRIDMPIIGRETPPATCAESLTLPATGRSPLVLLCFIHTKLESQVDFLRNNPIVRMVCKWRKE
jgi:CheY-like chemotaxis protein